MCRNIRTLFNFAPPATDDEIAAAALQFVRKLSGFTKPSAHNAAPFQRAIDQVTAVARELIDGMESTAPPRDRDVEVAKARARNAIRFGRAPAAPVTPEPAKKTPATGTRSKASRRPAPSSRIA